MSKISPVPQGFRTVTPHLIVGDGKKAIDFYQRAFGAEVVRKIAPPGGPVMHADLKIGDSIVMLADEMEGQKAPQGQTPVTIHLYVPNADATFANAVKAGAQPVMPLTDMPWGDRYGAVVDPFGHSWSIATRVEEVSDAELFKRLANAPAQ